MKKTTLKKKQKKNAKILQGNINKVIFFVLAVCIVIVGQKASDQSKQIESIKAINTEIENLLTGENSALGYSCGVLSQKQASELLGNNTNLNRRHGQGPTDRIRQDLAPEENIFWTDSCRYQDSTSSNKYVEMFVSTFDSEESAEAAFPNFLQLVNDAEKVSSQDFGQELVYDGGAFYLLKDNRVIQVSASNGGSQDLDLFSREVFESVFNKL